MKIDELDKLLIDKHDELEECKEELRKLWEENKNIKDENRNIEINLGKAHMLLEDLSNRI